MDDEILFAEAHLKYAMDNFIQKKLKQMEHVTLMEIINDTILRKLFISFIEYFHAHESECLQLLKRFMICQKIIANRDAFDDKETYEKLIELCPSFVWEQKLKQLKYSNKRDISFVHIMENLKWGTIIEIICHHQYKFFLSNIRQKSTLIVKLLKNIYKNYYF